MAILRIEVGKILLDDVIDSSCGSHYQTVVFKNAYINPVVITFVMTYTGTEVVDVRVRNLTNNSCEIFMQEFNNGCHSDEWISYLVMEAGYYTLPDGTKIEAGSETIPLNATHTSPTEIGSFNTVSLSFVHTFPENPAFFATLNTHNNNDYMSVSTMNVTTSGVEIFQARGTSGKIPSNEVAGWLAIEASASGIFPGGSTYEVGSFSDGTDDGTASSTDPPHKVTYTNSYTEPPIAFSQIATFEGDHGAYERINDDATGSFGDLWVDNSNEDSYVNYTSSKIYLRLIGGGWSEGVNLYSANSYTTQGEYTLEFDWWPVPGSSWYDDDNTDAQHAVSFTIPGLTYNTIKYRYNKPYNYGYYFHLRSTKSNVINAGGATWSFSYSTFHRAKLIVNFDTLVQSIYMDDIFIGSTGMSAGVLDDTFKLNFHWHTYSNTASQQYDNMTLTQTYGGVSANARGAFWAKDYFETYAEETNTSSDVNHPDETFSHIVFDYPFDVIYDEEVGVVIPEERRNIWTVDPNVYKATSIGLGVYDLASEALINFVTFSGGVNAVWANDQYVYVATSASGVYRCTVSTVTGTLTVFSAYKSYPDITNDNVSYVHGNGNYLCATTISGVDRYRFSDSQRVSEAASLPAKCYQTTNGDYYYVVNPSFKIKELDGSIFDWQYSRIIEFSKPVPEDDYQILIEIPMTSPDDTYRWAATDGIDIRFIDEEGNKLFYFIESWDYVNPVQVWVKLNKDTELIYMLYGNRRVIDQSDSENTFRLYDHFEGTELSDKWTFSDGGNSSNTVTVANSLVTLHCDDDVKITLTSTRSVLGGVLEYNFRVVAATTDLDYVAQFTNAGVAVNIGCTGETLHRLVSRTSQGNIPGTKVASTSFKTHTVIESPNFQQSNYDGETLTASGVLDAGYRSISFSFGNSSTQPDIAIDWVRVSVYDPDPPIYTVGEHQNVNDVFEATELHAIYESGGSYVYSAETADTINSSYISDIHVTEGTSTYNDGNVIFLATTWGATVLEERRGDEENCEKRIYLLST